MLISLGWLGGRTYHNRFQLLQLSHHVDHHLLQSVETIILLIKALVMLGLLLFDLPQLKLKKDWARLVEEMGMEEAWVSDYVAMDSSTILAIEALVLFLALVSLPFSSYPSIGFFDFELINGLQRSCEILMGLHHWLLAIEEPENQWRKRQLLILLPPTLKINNIRENQLP